MILIVEDDPNKVRRIVDLLETEFVGVSIVERHSYQSGLKEAVASRPDLAILDMTMPTYDVTRLDKGGRTKPYAGMDILNELKRKGFATKSIVVTQFESFGDGPDSMDLQQLDAALRKEYPAAYLGAVFYQPSESRWREQLVALLSSAFPQIRRRQEYN